MDIKEEKVGMGGMYGGYAPKQKGIVLNKQLIKLTVVAVFEKIVSIIIVILFSCLDLFRGNILLQA